MWTADRTLPVLAPKQGNSQVVAFGNALPNATAGNPSPTDERSFPQAVTVAPAPQAVCASIIPAGSAPGPELVRLRNLRTSRSDSQLGGRAAFTQSESGGLHGQHRAGRGTSLCRELYGRPFCHILASRRMRVRGLGSDVSGRCHQPSRERAEYALGLVSNPGAHWQSCLVPAGTEPLEHAEGPQSALPALLP